MTPNRHELESKTPADNISIEVVEAIITDCSPLSIAIDFQSSYVVLRTSHQPDI